MGWLSLMRICFVHLAPPAGLCRFPYTTLFRSKLVAFALLVVVCIEAGGDRVCARVRAGVAEGRLRHRVRLRVPGHVVPAADREVDLRSRDHASAGAEPGPAVALGADEVDAVDG